MSAKTNEGVLLVSGTMKTGKEAHTHEHLLLRTITDPFGNLQ